MNIKKTEVEAMPHVTGRYASYEDWEDALFTEIGGEIDIEDDGDNSYHVYSHDYGQHDTYTLTIDNGSVTVHDERSAKVVVSKCGGTASAGAVRYRIPLPSDWAADMGITADSRDIVMRYDGRSITITRP